MTRRADPTEYLPTVVIGAGALLVLTLGSLEAAVLLASWGVIDLLIARRLRRG